MIQITKELYNNLNVVSPSILSTTELIPKLIDDENFSFMVASGDGTTWVDEPLMLSDAQKKGFRFDISLTISDNEHIFYISDASNESVLGFSRVTSTDTDYCYFWDYREAIDIHSRGEESNYEVRILSDDLIIVGCTDSETYLIYKSEKDEDYGGEVWRYHGKLETSGEVSLIKVITSKHQLLTFDHSSDLFNLVTYQP